MKQAELWSSHIDIGFTGTRWGMGEIRKPLVSYIIEKLEPYEAHHGMCKGADTEFHYIVREVMPNAMIIGHPPIKKGTYIFSECDGYWDEKDYKVRDKDIVDCSHILIATPQTTEEVLRSGSWTTIRYAKKVVKADKGKCKKIYIVKPDGKVDYFDRENL